MNLCRIRDIDYYLSGKNYFLVDIIHGTGIFTKVKMGTHLQTGNGPSEQLERQAGAVDWRWIIEWPRLIFEKLP